MQSPIPFQLLKSFSLPDVGEINEPGLIVVVGPNSSGKTQLLIDLHARLAGEARELVVAENVLTDRPSDFESFSKEMIEAGQFKLDELTVDTLRPQRSSSTNSSQITVQSLSQLKNSYDQFAAVQGKKNGGRVDFLVNISQFLVATLLIDRRFSVLSPAGLIAYQSQAPQSDLHSLDLSDEAKEELASEIRNSFGKDIWPDKHSGNSITLKIADQPYPTDSEKLSHPKMQKYRTIDSEGHGLKSYVAICLALLLGRKSVALVDEPELCLHPPQAFRLGKFIGRKGDTLSSWTILSTHSSSFLRGIIESGNEIRIVRLHRKGFEFHAKYLDSLKLKEVFSKPNLMAESALDGIFADCAVVLESDGDRIVYGAALDKLNGSSNFSVHLSIASGSGTIPKLCTMYKELNVPVVVIADLDVIFQVGLLCKILKSLDSSKNFTALVSTATEIANSLLGQKSAEASKDTKSDLEKVLSDMTSSVDANRSASATKLRRIANLIDPARKLYEGWRTGVDSETQEKLDGLLAQLRLVGLFLVPVGELEDWSELGERPADNMKGEWAISAVEKISSLSVGPSEFLSFVQNVKEHLGHTLAS